MKELARFTKSRLCVVWLIITACALCDLFQTVANGNTQNTWINFIMKLIWSIGIAQAYELSLIHIFHGQASGMGTG